MQCHFQTFNTFDFKYYWYFWMKNFVDQTICVQDSIIIVHQRPLQKLNQT